MLPICGSQRGGTGLPFLVPLLTLQSVLRSLGKESVRLYVLPECKIFETRFLNKVLKKKHETKNKQTNMNLGHLKDDETTLSEYVARFQVNNLHCRWPKSFVGAIHRGRWRWSRDTAGTSAWDPSRSNEWRNWRWWSCAEWATRICHSCRPEREIRQSYLHTESNPFRPDRNIFRSSPRKWRFATPPTQLERNAKLADAIQNSNKNIAH